MGSRSDGDIAGLGDLGLKEILHVGCSRASLPGYFPYEFREIRLDIDPEVQPDIVADMSELPDIGPFDVVYSSHCLEHLFPHKVGPCLQGFKRVLKPGGVAIIFVPDLGGLEPTEDILYESGAGTVRAADLFYGFRQFIEANPFMAHRTGFVQATLRSALENAGFSKVTVKRFEAHNLFGVAVK